MARPLFVALVLLSSCAPLDAATACAKLASAGASECKEAKLEGLAYALVGRGYEFKLSGVEKPGRVLDFADGEKFKTTKEGLVGFARISGEHVIANDSKLLLVELPKETTKETADAVQAAVNSW